MDEKSMVLIKKEMKQVFLDKQIFIPILIFPAIFLIGIPLFFSYSIITGQVTAKDKEIFMIGYNLVFPILFFMAPIMTSAVIASASFVGERLSGTIESLLYCPVTVKQIFVSKILGVFSIVYSITLAYTVMFGVIINLATEKMYSLFMFPDVKWLIIIFWVAPAVALLTITITVTVSAKVKSFEAAQQITSFLSLPVVFPFIGQLSGYYFISSLWFFIGGAGLFILDYCLIMYTSKKFTIEKLVSN